MPTKKKPRKRTFAERSASAIKGHETRRLRKLPEQVRKAQKLVDNARVVVGKKPRKKIDKRTKEGKRKAGIAGESADERIARLERELAYAQSELAALAETAHFTHIKPQRMLRADGTVALESSRLRHREETKKIRRALEEIGDPYSQEFEVLAFELSEFYDVELQEVYTLFWSP